MYGLPAMIDHIIKQTEQEKIFMVTHNQVQRFSWSERPEYQEKVIALPVSAIFMSGIENSLLQVLSLVVANDNIRFKI